MPNWCSNELIIIGKEDDLIKFKIQAKGTNTDLCLNNFVPMPKELEDTRSPGPWPNWYDWRIYNWGIKWDIEGHLIGESESILIYEFDSAWSPPTNWISKVASIFPELSFELYFKESGMCFQGTMIAKEDLSVIQEEDYYEDIDEWEKDERIARHYQAMKDFEDMRF